MLSTLQTVVGAVAFPDFLYSTPNVLGLALSMIGAVWYAMQSAMRVGGCSTVCLWLLRSTQNACYALNTPVLRSTFAGACCFLTCFASDNDCHYWP